MTQSFTQPKADLQVRDAQTNNWVDVGATRGPQNNAPVPVGEAQGRSIEGSGTELLLAIHEELGDIKELLAQMVAAQVASPVASRGLPQADFDNMPSVLRVGRYGEGYGLSPVRKQHLLADEGAYYVANNAQTGIATQAVDSMSLTKALAVIANYDSPSNPAAKRIYLDYMTLVTTVAGGWASGGVNEQLALYLDNGDVYKNGGTDLTSQIVSPNMDSSPKSSVAKVRFGAVSNNALSNGSRCVCGLRILRPAVSATVADVVGEVKTLNFGGVEAMLNGSITVANANMISVPMPPVIIGPGQCCAIFFCTNGTTSSAPSFAPEFGWFER